MATIPNYHQIHQATWQPNSINTNYQNNTVYAARMYESDGDQAYLTSDNIKNGELSD